MKIFRFLYRFGYILGKYFGFLYNNKKYCLGCITFHSNLTYFVCKIGCVVGLDIFILFDLRSAFLFYKTRFFSSTLNISFISSLQEFSMP